MAFELKSRAFPADGMIPRRHTCDGEDLSPPLAWSGAPPGTKSFAITCADPDAPAGTWHHWAAFDIPQSMASLPEHVPAEGQGTIRQAFNDFRRKGYGGPCPPPGHGVHHYHFTLFALKVEKLPLAESVRCPDVVREARANALAEAELVGRYRR